MTSRTGDCDGGGRPRCGSARKAPENPVDRRVFKRRVHVLVVGPGWLAAGVQRRCRMRDRQPSGMTAGGSEGNPGRAAPAFVGFPAGRQVVRPAASVSSRGRRPQCGCGRSTKGLHYFRDVTWDEEHGRIHTRSAPQASRPSAIWSPVSMLPGVSDVAASNRALIMNPFPVWTLSAADGATRVHPCSAVAHAARPATRSTGDMGLPPGRALGGSSPGTCPLVPCSRTEGPILGTLGAVPGIGCAAQKVLAECFLFVGMRRLGRRCVFLLCPAGGHSVSQHLSADGVQDLWDGVLSWLRECGA